MVDLMGKKKRLAFSLSFFASGENDQGASMSSKPIPKSPRAFHPFGEIGLGIVAAMDDLEHPNHPLDPPLSAKFGRAATIFELSPRSTAISRPSFKTCCASPKFGPVAPPTERDLGETEPQAVELSEEYTCVISHVGDTFIKKREYYDPNLENESTNPPKLFSFSSSSFPPILHLPPPSTSLPAEPFLSSCHLCKKNLLGLDIFMYKERAFCSGECRCKQISEEDRMEKRGAGVVFQPHIEYSTSPCSGPMQFLAGVAAA